MVAANDNQQYASAHRAKRAVGVCYVINGTNDVHGNRLDKGDRHVPLFPDFNAGSYMGRYEGKDIRFEGGTTFKLIQAPKHGVIKDLTNTTDPYMPGGGGYQYLANEGYFGDDFAIMRVQNKGISVDVYYFIRVTELHENVSQVYLENCPAVYRGSGGFWKISATTPDGTPIFSNEDTAVSSVGTYTPTPSPLLSNYSNTVYPNLTYSFTNLPGTAVGETTGEGAAANILLDINAAGRGWYISGAGSLGLEATNPTANLSQWESGWLNNDDYLPTSNPNEWIAKAGSAAADKMDLLSVLLHEYGHALGFEHSSDPHDFMGTSLTAGVRRLPTADEMQLMANLIGEIRTQNQRHSALDAESRTGFDEIAGLARNDKLLNDKLYSSRRLG